MACWAVRPWTAMFAGTNQSSESWVVWSCSSRTPRRVVGAFLSCAEVARGTASRRRKISFFMGGDLGDAMGEVYPVIRWDEDRERVAHACGEGLRAAHDDPEISGTGWVHAGRRFSRRT